MSVNDVIFPLDGRELGSEGKVTVHGNGILVIGSVAAIVGLESPDLHILCPH